VALSKPRKITVDGKLYHWKISSNGVLHLAVFDPDTQAKFAVDFIDGGKITPHYVRKYIKQAYEDGWKKGKTLKYIHTYCHDD
jgi:hypothetical protein